MITVNLPHKKTLICYNGGSAGDFYAASLNGIDITDGNSNRVNGRQLGFSIKHLQPQDRDQWHRVLSSVEWPFVTTHHDLTVFVDIPVNWMEIIFTDFTVMELCVLRQMTLQHLSIQVDAQSDWYRVVKSLCDKSKFETAAKFWLHRSRNLWLEQMQRRLAVAGSIKVNFDHLFDDDFVTTVWNGARPDILAANHRHWLSRNQPRRWNSVDTISSMAAKLAVMPWHHTQGIIKYEP